MARFVYSLAVYALLPLVLARLWWRGRRNPGYRRDIGERFGRLPGAELGDCIWVHAVSVGEVVVAAPLVAALRRRHPGVAMLVTTTTPTGRDQARRALGAAATIAYLPWDQPGSIRRLLGRCRPRLLVLVETELWPNLVHCCTRAGIPVALVNARLSERSARGYRRLPALVRPMLGALAMVAAQSKADAERLAALGVEPDRLHVTGNIKFDNPLSDADQAGATLLRRRWHTGHSIVWIAASVHGGEDAAVVDAFGRIRARRPGVLLVLVPRHPERFDAAEALCRARGLATVRHSGAAPVDADIDVVIGDTIGELRTLFGGADIAFVGGSLVDIGGHNLLEPAAWGMALVTGPHLYNFAEAARLLTERAAMITVADSTELAGQVAELAGDDARRRAMGVAAAAVVATGRGVTQRVAGLLEDLLARGGY